jgi:hypothetical protein
MRGPGADGTPGRSALPLALTLLVHLVLLLAWRQGRVPGRSDDAAPAAIAVLLLQAPRPAQQDRPVPAPHRPPAPVARSRQLPSTPAAPPPAEAAPAPPPPTATVDALAPTAPAPGASAADILARALHDAGSVDRALRGSKPGVLRGKDAPMARMRREMASAYIDRSHVEKMDIYTAPDGEVIYRFRRGDKVRCRMTGSTGLGIPGGYTDGARLAGAGSLGGGGKAGFVSCPSHVEWARQ